LRKKIFVIYKINMDENKESETKTKESLDLCPICQDHLTNPQSTTSTTTPTTSTTNITSPKIRVLPCEHTFHEECIKTWIDMRNLCPLCNKVADGNKPVKELNPDHSDLDQQLISSILSNAINPAGVNFWAQIFDPLTFLGLDNGMLGRVVHRPNMSTIELNPPLFFNFPTFPNQTFPNQPFSNNLIFPNIPSVVNNTRPTFPNQPFSTVNNTGPLYPYNYNRTPDHYLPSSNPNPNPNPSHDIDNCEQAQCANCLNISCVHHIKRCSGCHQIRYCGQACQQEHWIEHKEWCLKHR